MHYRKKTGTTLVVVLVIMVVLSTFIGVALDYTTTMSRNVQRDIALQQAEALSEGMLEVAYANWRQQSTSSNQTLLRSSSGFETIGFPQASYFIGGTVNGTTYYSVSLSGSYRIGTAATTPSSASTGGNSWSVLSYYGVVAAGANMKPSDYTTVSPPAPGSIDYIEMMSGSVPNINGSTEPLATYDIPMATGSITTGTLSGIGSSAYYIASADVTIPVLQSTVTSHVRRVFRRQLTSPFQYAIFYNDSMESRNPPAMTVTGKVFTNSDIWWYSMSNVTFEDQVNYAGSVGYVNFTMNYNNPDSEYTTGEDPRYYNYGTSPTSGTFAGGVPSYSSAQNIYNISATTDSLDPNNIYHGLIEPPPITGGTTTMTGGTTSLTGTNFAISGTNVTIGGTTSLVLASVSGTYTDPFAYTDLDNNPSSYRFYNQADIVVSISTTGSAYVYSQIVASGTSVATSGTFVQSTPASTSGTINNLVYFALMGGTYSYVSGTTHHTSVFTPAIVNTNGVPSGASSGSFTDARQDSTVSYTGVNVGQLSANLVQSSTLGLPGLPNGIVYLTNLGTTTNTVYNNDGYGNTTPTTTAGALKAFELTSGSNIQQSNGLTIASEDPIYVKGDYNVGTLTSGTPSAAIVADAITVLSEGWNDADSGSMHSASGPITINAAFLSGIVPTNNNNFSGGIENFPRFLENWSGVSFTYTGSMVELFKSQKAAGKWQDPGNYYDPPDRNWSFNTQFLNDPPAGFNYNVVYSRNQWFLQ